MKAYERPGKQGLKSSGTLDWVVCFVGKIWWSFEIKRIERIQEDVGKIGELSGVDDKNLSLAS